VSEIETVAVQVRQRCPGDSERRPGGICDVTDETQVVAMVGRTITAFGRVDILVNNPVLQAVPHRRSFDRGISDALDVNLIGRTVLQGVLPR